MNDEIDRCKLCGLYWSMHILFGCPVPGDDTEPTEPPTEGEPNNATN